jgi:integrase
MSTKPIALSSPATLAEVLGRLTAIEALPRQRRLDLMSGVRRVARLMGDVPADIPAEPEALRRRLKFLTPAAAGMTPSRLRNVRALLTAALDLTGTKMMRGRRRAALAPVWHGLLKSVASPYERHKLSRFFSFVSAQGIDPDQVNDQTVSQFAESLERNSLIERRIRIVRDSCRIWNKCAQTIAGWPNTQLTVQDRRRVYALHPGAYPASFGDDVSAYLSHLAHGDLFGGTGRGAASAATLRDVRLRLFQMAAALVHSGRAPETIRSLADLVAPEALKTVLTFFWSRNGNRKTGQIHNVALAAIKIAKWWVKAPQEQIEALRDIRRQVDPKNSGMTERNRARLRQFDDPENLRRLIRLPDEILRSLPRSRPPSFTEAIRAQSALAVGILLVAPMRVKNLAALHARHLVQTRPGGARHLVIPANEVKNRTDLVFEVSIGLGELLDVYLARCRPSLVENANGFLFPARNGGAKAPKHLAEQIQRAIAKETGVDLNAHAFRHLAAKLFLQEHPGEYETTRLILGHKDLNTTVRAYCGLEQADALRRLDALIDRHRHISEKRNDSPPSHP